MRFLFVVAVPLCLLGCQSLQSQEDAARMRAQQAEAVVVTESEERVADCELVATVTVAPPFPFLNQAFPELTAVGRRERTTDLRREAYRAGGDTILRTGPHEGKAYDCRRAPS
jgi:hypothetical protein